MVLNRCVVCGCNFEDKNEVITCSEECKNRFDRGEFFSGRVVVNCMVCGKDIHTTYYRIKTNHNKTCSKKCQFIRQSEKLSGENCKFWNGGNIKLICIECGKEFESSKARVEKDGRGKFCSKECFFEYTRKHIKRGEEHSGYIPRVVTKCEWCGKELIRTQHVYDITEKSFCNQRCHGKWFSKNCSGENHPKFKNYINYHGYHHTFAQKKNQLRVRTLFKNTCIMCGKVHDDTTEDAIIHHIYLEQRIMEFEKAKYVCVCRSCHVKLHRDKFEWEYWTPYFIELIEHYMNGVCFI